MPFFRKKSRSDIRICVTMTSFVLRSDVTGKSQKIPTDPLPPPFFVCRGVFVGIISISRCADKCYRTSPGEREPPRRQTPQKRIGFFRSTLYRRRTRSHRQNTKRVTTGQGTYKSASRAYARDGPHDTTIPNRHPTHKTQLTMKHSRHHKLRHNSTPEPTPTLDNHTSRPPATRQPNNSTQTNSNQPKPTQPNAHAT